MSENNLDSIVEGIKKDLGFDEFVTERILEQQKAYGVDDADAKKTLEAVKKRVNKRVKDELKKD